MHWPYTPDFAIAFFAAQVCAGLALSALLLHARFGGWGARGAMLAAIWLTVVSPGVPAFASSIGLTPGPGELRVILAVGAGLGALAALLAGRPKLCAAGFVAAGPLWALAGYVTESEQELACLHLAWLGLLLGLLVRPRTTGGAARAASPVRSYARADAMLFVGATAIAAAVSTWVLRHGQGSADEWGYVYQAAVFAKGHAYSTVPRCQPYLESYWVFEREGRLFAQYTPGWPLVLTPFVAMGIGWMAAPVSLGLLAVGAARLGRSAVRLSADGGAPPSHAQISAAGWWAGVCATMGATVLLNAGSFFGHCFSMAAYAWMIEAMLVVTTPGLGRAPQLRWGLVLGATAAMMLATRPGEGAMLGLGPALYFAYAVGRRRVGARAIAVASLVFVLIGALTLVILRLQLGKWFMTGYAMAGELRPANDKLTFAMPRPNEWKYGLPLATGAYCWWPACVPLGLAGFAMMRGRALALVTAFGVGWVTYTFFCEWLTFGTKGWDWGYGPRYFMPIVIPMSVGGAVALAPLTAAARRVRGGGPFALALFAAVSGWVRLVSILWPPAAEFTRHHWALVAAIDSMHLENAIVLTQPRLAGNAPKDQTTNLPIDLYPDQPVIIALDSPEAVACVRNAFPGRRLYHATGAVDVTIRPE